MACMVQVFAYEYLHMKEGKNDSDYQMHEGRLYYFVLAVPLVSNGNGQGFGRDHKQLF